MKRKYKLCLFDLDGVIIDSRSNMERSWSAVQSVFELDSPFEGYFQVIGRPFQDIMSVLDYIGLGQAITSQRTNGFLNALKTIKKQLKTYE